MSRLYRTILATKKAVITGDVVITVKEYFLDPENLFADTFVKNLEGITVKLGEVEETTNASGVASFDDIEDGTHTLQVYKMDSKLTTHKEQLVVSEGATETIKLYECLYTPNEVNNLIEPDAWAAGTYPVDSRVVHSGTVYVANTETSEEPPHADWDEDDFYIPVATDSELDNLRNTAEITMGSGTIFEGAFTTGLDKKYVQVRNIDLINYQESNGFASIQIFIGTYDGNELFINNLKRISTRTAQSLFTNSTNPTAFPYIRNIKIINADIQGGTGYERGQSVIVYGAEEIDNCYVYNSSVNIGEYDAAGIITSINWNDKVVKNCKVINCTINGTDELGGITGINEGTVENCQSECTITGTKALGGITGTNEGTVENCQSECTITGEVDLGGIVGANRNDNSNINNCNSIVNITASGGSSIQYGNWTSSRAGGIVGSSRDVVTIKECYSTGIVKTTATGNTSRGVGGLVGETYYFSEVLNCYTHCEVQGDVDVGGFAGRQWSDGEKIENCYSTGKVTGNTNVGGFCGNNESVITNSYWDTQTSEQANSDGGEGRTTKQMQEGTADSFILPAGGEDTDEISTNAMYTTWSDLIWDFGLTTEYPILEWENE